MTNTGNVTLTGIVVDDPRPGIGPIACPVTSLAPGEASNCSATYQATQADLDAGRIDNTATVTGTPPRGPDVTDSSSATVTATRTPAIDLDKSATPTSVTAAGETVTYSMVVTNTGNVTLTGIVVDDPLPGLSPVNCPATTLTPGATTTCTASYDAAQSDIDNGSWSNVATATATATATGTPPAGAGPDVSDTDNETVTAAANPSITIDKTATPTTVTTAGATITYTFTVTNTGNVTLAGISVSDPMPGLSGISCPATTLAPAAATSCTATYTATQADIDAGRIDNTATASGAPPVGIPVVSGTDTETVLIQSGRRPLVAWRASRSRRAFIPRGRRFGIADCRPTFPCES